MTESLRRLTIAATGHDEVFWERDTCRQNRLRGFVMWLLAGLGA